MTFTARYHSLCYACDEPIRPGDEASPEVRRLLAHLCALGWRATR